MVEAFLYLKKILKMPLKRLCVSRLSCNVFNDFFFLIFLLAISSSSSLLIDRLLLHDFFFFFTISSSSSSRFSDLGLRTIFLLRLLLKVTKSLFLRFSDRGHKRAFVFTSALVIVML